MEPVLARFYGGPWDGLEKVIDPGVWVQADSRPMPYECAGILSRLRGCEVYVMVPDDTPQAARAQIMQAMAR